MKYPPSIALVSSQPHQLTASATIVVAETSLQRVRRLEAEMKTATVEIVDGTLNSINGTLDRLHEAASCPTIPSPIRDAMLRMARQVEEGAANAADLLNKAGLIKMPYSPR